MTDESEEAELPDGDYYPDEHIDEDVDGDELEDDDDDDDDDDGEHVEIQFVVSSEMELAEILARISQ